MEQQLEDLQKQANKELAEVSDASALEAWRVLYIGRKGKLPELLRGVKDLGDEEKRVIGKAANILKRTLEEAYSVKQESFIASAPNKLMKALPAGRQVQANEASVGHLHPITLTIERVQNIFAAMGFIIADGPEVEEARYNFDALNIPSDHPARGEGDTFMIDPKSVSGEQDVVLRTQTSPMQIRSVETMRLTPPFYVIAPGRVYLREKVDATHESTFYQFEGLGIGEDITIADFKGVIAAFFSTFFQKDVTVRLRPSYFPFVEPGFEVDMSCVFCAQKGCRVCKYTGWIEVMGAGMVHPNVLKNMNIDPTKYQGFAFGGAIDRLTMIRHGINDIRMFWSGDIRFLRQFSNCHSGPRAGIHVDAGSSPA
ncbi:MAG: phenylalanine--tRNA ligase subunit alpha [Candidatus Andersenbacteria bacterium RIFCSPHIGHO2_02_FULL_45_11]|nr:MAG: phenylalanine--tRNA ligase subunit alpha [Candidatus Andersenbacteria bacterium RIFCSPHIGHO2_02_FULL_45_11]